MYYTYHSIASKSGGEAIVLQALDKGGEHVNGTAERGAAGLRHFVWPSAGV